jgi:oxaloacetate decarboxylase gamma subunit
MDSNAINEALQLLLVGMGTVFIILGLVVFMGRQLIGAVNRWMPATVVPKPSPSSSSATDIEPGVLAAIVAAVDIVTGGKGKVEHVEKK